MGVRVMIGKEKIGCGILTFNRPHLLVKLYESLPHELLDVVYIVNDGAWHDAFHTIPKNLIHHNSENIGIGRSKNKALQYLLDQGCEHIFLIEDDIFIKERVVFEAYIEASRLSGIQHFNFSQHGRMNKTGDGLPKSVGSASYGEAMTIMLYRHCVGAFSYYSRRCLTATGLMDIRFHNALEHVDHTLNIIKHSMHPPFWYFADIVGSHQYLGDEEWSVEQSTISSSAHHQYNVADAISMFALKHGCAPSEFPIASEADVYQSLRHIRYLYGPGSDPEVLNVECPLELIM